jgi:hypothetical protein
MVVRNFHARMQRADQAAIKAAKEKFPAELEPTCYAYQGERMERLLSDIEDP